MATTEGAPPIELPAPGEYGDRVIAVEPGGIEPVPDADKHGKPIHLLWTWASPNLEFATVFVGALAVFAFGLTFWQAVAALVLGNLLGALTHAVLSARGPRYGVPQMVLSRLAFGYWGNVLPAGINAVMAGVGWFAVNSVSGAFALSSLTGLPTLLCLVLIVVVQLVVAFFGHNLVHAFERYALPLLAVVFAVGTVILLSSSEPSAAEGGGGLGGFLLTASAAFGYSAGWNPYAADYTRYLPATVSRRAAGMYAGLGMFLACSVLMIAGAASVTAGADYTGNPAAAFTGELPSVLANLTLLCIALGAVAANALNVYSGALSFLCLNIRLPLAWRRASVSASINPRTVYSFATTSTVSPNSRAVAAVIGPIQAMQARLAIGSASSLSSLKKLRTVDELVNVITSTPCRSASNADGRRSAVAEPSPAAPKGWSSVSTDGPPPSSCHATLASSGPVLRAHHSPSSSHPARSSTCAR
jgi:NCS1 nucleoside transporter family